jgi:AMP deaminase
MCRTYETIMLTNDRIDRYTRAAQSNRNDLTMSNLQPTTEVPRTPKSVHYQGSPNTSMNNHPSTFNMSDQTQHFSSLPPGAMSGPLGHIQHARLPQSASTSDTSKLPPQPTSPTGAKDSSHQELLHRTSSVTVNPSTVSASQPTGASTTSPQYQNDVDSLSLTRTTSSANLDGEPRIFPGVVSRSTRRSSMRSSTVEDGAYPGYRAGGDTGSVVEERDTDDEE